MGANHTTQEQAELNIPDQKLASAKKGILYRNGTSAVPVVKSADYGAPGL